MGNAYFNAFLNCVNAYERYTLPIFGGAIALAMFTAINSDIYLLIDPIRIEAVLYIAGFISIMYLLIMSYNRVKLILVHFEGEELHMVLLYFGILLGMFIYSKKLDWDKIDIPSLLNILDSPSSL
jgi:hypothetical protein